MWNAQRNFNLFASVILAPGTNNLTQMALQGQSFLTMIFPSQRWMIYVYNNTKSAATVSWRCSNCFVTYAANVNYTFLVIGIPQSDAPNPEPLHSLTQSTTLDLFPAANQLADSVYSSDLCLSGLVAVYDTVNVQGAWSSNALQWVGSGIKVIQDNTSRNKPMVAAWSSSGQWCRQPYGYTY